MMFNVWSSFQIATEDTVGLLTQKQVKFHRTLKIEREVLRILVITL
jgi:hypothetical protein